MKYLLTILLGLLTCSLIAQHKIETTDWQKLIPSDSIPEELKIRKGNNNLDAVYYQGRYYVGFRTAPNHFASRKTLMHIISSEDFKSWRAEATFKVKADMREPRFVVYHDTLHFYFFEAGTNMLKFQPKNIWTSTLTQYGWTKRKELANLKGYVPWRLKVHDDKIFMAAYYGAGIYKDKGQGAVRFFISTDGRNFEPISKEPQCNTPHASELAFEFDEEGNMWGTIRIEGAGDYIVSADKDSLHKWELTFSKTKYDSPIMLRQDSSFYLISRRNLKGAATKWDTAHIKPAQRRGNLIRYSLTGKTCAIFRLDKQNRKFVHLQDFPARGDTAFPALARKTDNSYYLLNYSNNIKKKGKISWISGQLRKTNIYWTELSFD